MFCGEVQKKIEFKSSNKYKKSSKKNYQRIGKRNNIITVLSVDACIESNLLHSPCARRRLGIEEFLNVFGIS